MLIMAVAAYIGVNLITPRYKSEARVLVEGRENIFLRPEAEKAMIDRGSYRDLFDRNPGQVGVEVDAGIFQHPLRIVGFDHRRLRREQRRVEADRMRDIVDGDVDMEALHGVSFQAKTLARLRAGLQAAAGAHGTPPQQFSVRKPSRAFMVSNCAA